MSTASFILSVRVAMRLLVYIIVILNYCIINLNGSAASCLPNVRNLTLAKKVHKCPIVLLAQNQGYEVFNATVNASLAAYNVITVLKGSEVVVFPRIRLPFEKHNETISRSRWCLDSSFVKSSRRYVLFLSYSSSEGFISCLLPVKYDAKEEIMIEQQIRRELDKNLNQSMTTMSSISELAPALPTYSVIVDTDLNQSSIITQFASVDLYGSVNLRCLVSGANVHPDPQLRVIHDGDYLQQGKEGIEIVQIKPTETLVKIKQFDLKHHGVYECRARRAGSEGKDQFVRSKLRLDFKRAVAETSSKDPPCPNTTEYCLNDGICRVAQDKVRYCDCPPLTSGPRCGIHLPSHYTMDTQQFNTVIGTVGAFLGIIIFSILLLLGCLYYHKVYLKKKRHHASIRSADGQGNMAEGTSLMTGTLSAQPQLICPRCHCAIVLCEVQLSRNKENDQEECTTLNGGNNVERPNKNSAPDSARNHADEDYSRS